MQHKAIQHMDDSGLYFTAFQEAESDDMDEALWAKAITLAEGDMDSARYKYIKLRVEQLRCNSGDDAPSSLSHAENGSTSVVPEGYISVSELAAKSSIDKETIIQNIIDGVWDAQKIHNQWYIPAPESFPDSVKPEDTAEQPTEQPVEQPTLIDAEDTPSITATRAFSYDDDVPDVEAITLEDWPPIESTIDALSARNDNEAFVKQQEPAEDPELTLEPLEEDSKHVKKDLVACIASITARFAAVVAALLLITVVTNLMREMHLDIEVEIAVHGTTAVLLIFMLYYVWIKTRLCD
jgi:hypothetical protein